jgi:hypothetical protein
MFLPRWTAAAQTLSQSSTVGLEESGLNSVPIEPGTEDLLFVIHLTLMPI